MTDNRTSPKSTQSIILGMYQEKVLVVARRRESSVVKSYIHHLEPRSKARGINSDDRRIYGGSDHYVLRTHAVTTPPWRYKTLCQETRSTRPLDSFQEEPETRSNQIAIDIALCGRRGARRRRLRFWNDLVRWWGGRQIRMSSLKVLLAGAEHSGDRKRDTMNGT